MSNTISRPPHHDIRPPMNGPQITAAAVQVWCQERGDSVRPRRVAQVLAARGITATEAEIQLVIAAVTVLQDNTTRGKSAQAHDETCRPYGVGNRAPS